MPAEELQRDLGAGVRLREHGSARLDQDVVLGQFGRLRSHIDIGDLAVGGLEVGAVRRERLRREVQAAALSAVLGGHRGHRGDGCGDITQRDGSQGYRRVAATGDRCRVAGEVTPV